MLIKCEKVNLNYAAEKDTKKNPYTIDTFCRYMLNAPRENKAPSRCAYRSAHEHCLIPKASCGTFATTALYLKRQSTSERCQ